MGKMKSAGQKTKDVLQKIVGGGSKEDSFYIMLLGETGSGKSTLLNMLVNFFRGKPEARTVLPKQKDLKVAVPTAYLKPTEPEGIGHSERDKSDRSKSQSTKCIEYVFSYTSVHGKRVKVHVIDTPGLSDTEGADDEHLDKILEAAAGLPFISAIILVANGSVARETITIKNVFTLLRGHMPDAVLENTMAVMTNCNSITRNLDPKKLPMRIKPQHLFHMQNSAFSSDPKRWAKAAPDEKKGLDASWAASLSTVKQITEEVLTLSAASSAAFADMRKLREQIKTKMASTLSELRNMQQLEDALEQAKILQSHAMEDSEKYKDYVKNETVTEIEIVDAPYHSTLCSNCRTVCHDHCGLQETSNQGDMIFAGCAALQGEGNTCTVCEGHCGVSAHYHARKTVQTVEKSVEKVLEDMKKKYQDALDQMGGAQANAVQAETDLDMIKQVQQQKMDEIKQLCEAIKAIASGFNLVDELSVVITGLEMESRQLKSVKARESADNAINDLSAFIDQLSGGSNSSSRPDNDFDYDTINNLGLDEASDSDDSVEEADEEPRGRGATSGGRRPRLAANKSLASQVDGLSGKDRQAVLDAYARQNPFELNPNSEDKDMIKKLAEQVAFLTKTLGAVTQYSGLVNTPERAVASPKAASIASLAKERLAEKMRVLMEEMAESERLEAAQGQQPAYAVPEHDRDESCASLKRFGAYNKPQSMLPPRVDIQVLPGYPQSQYVPLPHDGYRQARPQIAPEYVGQGTHGSVGRQGYRPTQPDNATGRWPADSQQPQQSAEQQQQSYFPGYDQQRPPQPYQGLQQQQQQQQYGAPRSVGPAPYQLHKGPDLAAPASHQQNDSSASSPQPLFNAVRPETQQGQNIVASSQPTAQMSSSLASVTSAAVSGGTAVALLVQGQQVGNLYKLVGNKGKKRDAIADITDCKIIVPPSEDWDEQLGVTIVVEGRNPKLAEQLITDALR